jgi:hypothetical protein
MDSDKNNSNNKSIFYDSGVIDETQTNTFNVSGFSTKSAKSNGQQHSLDSIDNLDTFDNIVTRVNVDISPNLFSSDVGDDFNNGYGVHTPNINSNLMDIHRMIMDSEFLPIADKNNCNETYTENNGGANPMGQMDNGSQVGGTNDNIINNFSNISEYSSTNAITTMSNMSSMSDFSDSESAVTSIIIPADMETIEDSDRTSIANISNISNMTSITNTTDNIDTIKTKHSHHSQYSQHTSTIVDAVGMTESSLRDSELSSFIANANKNGNAGINTIITEKSITPVNYNNEISDSKTSNVSISEETHKLSKDKLDRMMFY